MCIGEVRAQEEEKSVVVVLLLMVESIEHSHQIVQLLLTSRLFLTPLLISTMKVFHSGLLTTVLQNLFLASVTMLIFLMQQLVVEESVHSQVTLLGELMDL